MRLGPRPWHVSNESMAALRLVQDGLATLSPAVDGPMPWLVVMSAPASSLPNLHTSLAPLAGCDFHLHLFDVNSTSEAGFQSLVDRASFVQTASVTIFVRGNSTGCKLENWVISLREVLFGRMRARQYSHVWFMDFDLDFRFMHLPALKALVAHSAPWISQPAVLRWMKTARSSDFMSLEGKLAAQVTGRPRCLQTKVDPVEVMMPIFDARILPAFYEEVKDHPMKTVFAAGLAMTALARRFNASFPGRPACMVFDYTPVIHLDQRTIPGKQGMGSVRNKTALGQKLRCIRGMSALGNGVGDFYAHRIQARYRNLSMRLPEEGGCSWRWGITTRDETSGTRVARLALGSSMRSRAGWAVPAGTVDSDSLPTSYSEPTPTAALSRAALQSVLQAVARYNSTNQVLVATGKLTRSQDDQTILGPRMTRSETAVWLYLLMHSRRYLEWGMGGTTRLAAWRANSPSTSLLSVTSVETSQDFIEAVRQSSSDVRTAEKARRLSIRTVAVETAAWGKPSGWDHMSVGDKSAQARAFVEAVRVDECCFDLILIDGRWRVASALHALRLSHETTRFLIHDYSIRLRSYKAAIEPWFATEWQEHTLQVFRARPGSQAAANAATENFTAAYMAALLAVQ